MLCMVGMVLNCQNASAYPQTWWSDGRAGTESTALSPTEVCIKSGAQLTATFFPLYQYTCVLDHFALFNRGFGACYWDQANYCPDTPGTSTYIYRRCIGNGDDNSGICECPSPSVFNPSVPDGHAWGGGVAPDGLGACVIGCPTGQTDVKGACLPPTLGPKGNGGCPPGGCTQGTNPINPGPGIKFAQESIYQGTGAFPLALSLAYNSIPVGGLTGVSRLPWTTGFGAHWLAPHLRNIYNIGGAPTLAAVDVQRPDGKIYRYKQAGANYVADADVSDNLVRLLDGNGTMYGWQLTSKDGDQRELYNQVGIFLSVANRQGLLHKLAYADGNGGVYYTAGNPFLIPDYTPPLCAGPNGWVYEYDGATPPQPKSIPSNARMLCIEDSFGRQIHFQYDASGHIIKMADPGGGIYQFEYDGPSAASWVTGYFGPGGGHQGHLSGWSQPDVPLQRARQHHLVPVAAADGLAGTPDRHHRRERQLLRDLDL